MTPTTMILRRCLVLGATAALLAACGVGTNQTDQSAPSAPQASGSSAAPSASPVPAIDLPQSAAPLPDNEMVWRHQTQGTWAIATVNTRGLTSSELVVGHLNVAASLTPDRRTVLYLRREDGDQTSLHAVSADGQSDRRLFVDGSTDCPKLRRPAAGLNGQIAVVCSAYDRGDDDFLNLMTPTGKLVKRLDTGQIGDPTFSPDGRFLVYARDRYVPYSYGGALFSIPVDASAPPRRLVPGTNLNPVWSPAGGEVAYVHIDGRHRGISAVRVNDDGSSGGTEVLSTDDGYDQDPTWSPDGTQLAFRRGSAEPHLFVMRSDGDGARRVVKSGGAVSAPVWSAR